VDRKQARQFIIFGGVVIVAVLLIGLFVMSRGGGSSSGSSASVQPEVVALQTVPQGKVFRSGDSFGQYFTVKQVPSDLVPFGAYSSVQQISALTNTPGCGAVHALGCQGEITTTQTVFQNAPVVAGTFSTLGEYRTGEGPAFAIPYGYVGTAISFGADNAVLGSVNPGDDIDLLASYHPQGATSLSGGQTQYVLNDVRVLSVNGPPTVPGGTTSGSTTSQSSGSGSGGGMVLLVTYQQALEIQHLKDFGWTLSCVLRSAKETDIKHFKTLPVTDNWFYTEGSNHFTRGLGL